MAVWREQSRFTSLLYSGASDCVCYASLSLRVDTSTLLPDEFEAQTEARRLYESLDKRGPLVWRGGILRWSAQLSTGAGGGWIVDELGLASADLAADLITHKRWVRREMLSLRPPGYRD